MFSVYMLRVPDGRAYIGTTSQPLVKRWNNGNGYRFSKSLWDQIVLHGWEKVEKIIIGEGLTEEEACKLEREMILKHKSYMPECGFNRELGGTYKNKIVPDCVKERMSKAHTGELNYNYGKHFTESHKAKISESNKGKKRSDATKERCRTSHEKPVSQYSLSGKLIATYPSGKIASKETGTIAGHISKVCKGQRKTAGGYYWSYA